MMRCCAECARPFTRMRPPVEPVVLREGQPGHRVPRLSITIYGSLCAACARESITTARRRADP